jgi:hypothetical protein
MNAATNTKVSRGGSGVIIAVVVIIVILIASLIGGYFYKKNSCSKKDPDTTSNVQSFTFGFTSLKCIPDKCASGFGVDKDGTPDKDHTCPKYSPS